MAECCSWVSRARCCRRRPKETYIYLYNPLMGNSPRNHCCLVCILFVFCLVVIGILAAATIYHLERKEIVQTANDTYETARKYQLPDFVAAHIDPCKDFYRFVCDKWTRDKPAESMMDRGNGERQWTLIRHGLHGKLMTHLNNQSILNQSNQTASVYRLYQLCERQAPELLLDELERHFANLSETEPYRSHLTLFKYVNLSNATASTWSAFPRPNPFFTITSSLVNTSVVNRVKPRPSPSAISMLSDRVDINHTALQHLAQFDDDYQKLLSDESTLIRPYEQEFHQDSLIVRRIRTYSGYHRCLPSLTSTGSNGLDNLIRLLHNFLDSRLHNLTMKSIDGPIRVIDKITDNHTLVGHLQRLAFELNDIENIVVASHSNHSCVIDLLYQLLNKRIQSDELASMIDFSYFDQSADNFISNDWPFVFMLYDRLLKNTPKETLVNFAYFDYYRKLVYPYYQPHVHLKNDLRLADGKEPSGYTYHAASPRPSCRIDSCFDIFNCYHPALLNQVVNDHNQSTTDAAKNVVEQLLGRFRVLTDQSDHLFVSEKNAIRHELNQIQVRVGHHPSSADYSLPASFSTYFEYVQYLSSIAADESERSYYNDPIYYPSNRTLFLPFGFLSRSNVSIEYHLIHLLLKILRAKIHTAPYHIDCSLRSSDDEQETIDPKKLASDDDEPIAYLILRSSFLSEHKIVLDEYLWPFMSANALMKRFLIDYTASNYCRESHGYGLFRNNSYLLDDVHLMFRCPQASSIKQSKCSVN